jgi:outer membrane protein assembly factor BamB
VVVALGVTLGAPWYAVGRFVQRTETTAAAPQRAAEGPDRPGAIAWTRPARRALAGGGYAVVAEDVGGPGLRIAVLDAATGRERWAYRHSDAFVDARISPADGVLVLRRDRDGATRLLAFDLPTGRPLWTLSTDAQMLDDSTGFDEGARLLTAGVLLLQDGDDLVAVEPRTGARRWTRPGVACLGGTSAVRAAAGVLLLTGLCPSRTVTAVSAETGLPVWRAEVSATPVYTAGSGRPPLVVEGTVVLTVPDEEDEAGPDRLVALEATTGRVRWRADWRVGVLPAVAVGDLVVAVEAGGGTLTAVARDEESGRVAWRTSLGAVGKGVEWVAGSDAERLYLLSGASTGPVRVAVLTRGGQVAGAGSVPGCADPACTGAAVDLTGSTTVVASGGALVLLTAGGFRPVAAIADGAAYRER